jgi:hypothetical protein
VNTHHGATTDELIARGYTVQPDGRMRRFKSWKAQCADCQLWFHRLKGQHCWRCFDKAAIAHRRRTIDEEKCANRTPQA